MNFEHVSVMLMPTVDMLNVREGGIYVDGGNNSVTIRNCEISGNTAEYGDGGGIMLYHGGPLLIEDSRINGNSADYGGGIQPNARIRKWLNDTAK